MNWLKTNLIFLIIGLILIVLTLGYYNRHPSFNELPVDEERTSGSGIYEY